MAGIDVSISERIATIKMNRPESLNALNRETLESLHGKIKELSGNPEVSVIILTGEGKAFVAGADISEMKDMTTEKANVFSGLGQNAFFALENSPKITIAAVNGFALGGGCELAMACDLIYASEKAKFGQPEVNLGVIPGFGGTQRLMRYLGPIKARELIYTGEMISAEQAKTMGLVAEVFSPEELLSKVKEIAVKIISKSPEALSRAKESMRNGMDLELWKACAIEREQFGKCFGHADQKEGMNAFLEKRSPNWKR